MELYSEWLALEDDDFGPPTPRAVTLLSSCVDQLRNTVKWAGVMAILKGDPNFSPPISESGELTFKPEAYLKKTQLHLYKFFSRLYVFGKLKTKGFEKETAEPREGIEDSFTRNCNGMLEILYRAHRGECLPDEKSFFFTDFRASMKKLVNSTVTKEAHIEKTMELFFALCKCSVVFLEQDQDTPPIVLDYLKWMFGSLDGKTPLFFRSYGIEPSNSYSHDDGKFASLEAEGVDRQTTSVHIVRLVNYFGSLGGFEIMLQRLAASPPPEENATQPQPTPLAPEAISAVVKVLQTIDFVLMDDFVAHFYPIAKSVVYDRLMSLDEEELEESFNDRTSLLEVFVVLEDLISRRRVLHASPQVEAQAEEDEVSQWLDDIGLTQYHEQLTSLGFTLLADLKELAKEDFSEFDIKPGHVVRMLRTLRDFKVKVPGQEGHPTPR